MLYKCFEFPPKKELNLFQCFINLNLYLVFTLINCIFNIKKNEKWNIFGEFQKEKGLDISLKKDKGNIFGELQIFHKKMKNV